MDLILERCAGLDVHQATVTACLRLPGPGRTRTQIVQTFGTTTPDLLALRDWLAAHQRPSLQRAGPTWPSCPSDRHCAAWAGLCPGNHESAGTRKSGKTRKGHKWLRTALTEASWAASRTKSYLGAQYHRLARRRGKKRAAVAVAHSLLVIAYHILKDGTTFQDLGSDYFDRRDTAQLQRRLIGHLAAHGLRVTVEPLPLVA